IEGFSNCGKGFFIAWDSQKKESKAWHLSADVRYPEELISETADQRVRWLRPPKNSYEQFYHFLFFLRRTMFHLSHNPIGKKTTQTPAEIAQMLASLPRRAVFVRSGEDVATIFTENTPKMAPQSLFRQRVARIRE